MEKDLFEELRLLQEKINKQVSLINEDTKSIITNKTNGRISALKNIAEYITKNYLPLFVKDSSNRILVYLEGRCYCILIKIYATASGKVTSGKVALLNTDSGDCIDLLRTSYSKDITFENAVFCGNEEPARFINANYVIDFIEHWDEIRQLFDKEVATYITNFMNKRLEVAQQKNNDAKEI